MMVPATTPTMASTIHERTPRISSSSCSDDIVAALAQMTDEERTLALIKAARAAPLRPLR